MPKRQTNRKIIIRLIERDPADPRAILEAVEGAFRPKDVEIIVGRPPGEAPLTLADEPLETIAREQVAEVLDEKDHEAKERPADSAEAGPTAPAVVAAKASVRRWVAEKAAASWGVFVKVVPWVERGVKLAEGIEKIV